MDPMQKPNNELEFVDVLWKLKKKIERTLGHHVSLKLLLNDSKYRNSVIKKALEADEQELTSIATRAASLIKSHSTVLKDKSYSTEDVARLKEKTAGTIVGQQNAGHTVDSNTASKKWFPHALVASLLVAVIGFVGFYYFNQGVDSKTELAGNIPPSSSQAALQENAQLTQPKTNKLAQPLFDLVGSNTVGEKLAPALVKAYIAQAYPESQVSLNSHADFERTINFSQADNSFKIGLSAHGSSSAFKGLKHGDSVIGMASRRVKDKERQALNPLLGDLTQAGNEHIIGMDGLAVIVHPANPISSLTVTQVAALFSGKITNWQELGGADQAVNLYARANGSGTLDTFKSLVMKPNASKINTLAERFESSSELSDRVSNDAGAIGFIGLSYVRHARSLAIAQNANSLAIKPTAFTISTEDYPLSRRLYFYTKGNQPNIEIKDFIKFALSNKGQKVVEEMGLISQNIREQRVKAAENSPGAYKFISDSASRLSLNFRFKSGSNELDNKSKRDLERLVDYLKEEGSKQISLIGFSDSIGEATLNQTISVKRAQEVERELAQHGVSVNQTLGFGEALPLASNMTEFGRKKNRRVEVWVNI